MSLNVNGSLKPQLRGSQSQGAWIDFNFLPKEGGGAEGGQEGGREGEEKKETWAWPRA